MSRSYNVIARFPGKNKLVLFSKFSLFKIWSFNLQNFSKILVSLELLGPGLLWESLLIAVERFDVRCHGRPMRSLTSRQRDFLFKYRILRNLLRRSCPVRAVVSLENVALSRWYRQPAFLARAREVPPAVCPMLPCP